MDTELILKKMKLQEDAKDNYESDDQENEVKKTFKYPNEELLGGTPEIPYILRFNMDSNRFSLASNESWISSFI